jgi:Uma2 family endonuclease
MTMTRDRLIEALSLVEGRAEIVNGAIVMLPQFGIQPALAAGGILISLSEYADGIEDGYALPSTVAYIVDLPDRASLSPCVSFVSGVPLTMGFVRKAPDFAVEVRSESDYGPAAERMIAAKRADYFAAGTAIVWDVDLIAGTITSYSSGEPGVPRVFGRGDVADAEPAVPGWRFEVEQAFR